MPWLRESGWLHKRGCVSQRVIARQRGFVASVQSYFARPLAERGSLLDAHGRNSAAAKPAEGAKIGHGIPGRGV